MTNRLCIAIICTVLAGCKIDRLDPTPAQFEQAKTDCASFGGLTSVTANLMAPGESDYIEANCARGVRILRPLATGATE